MKGDGLTGPEPITLGNGVSYAVYAYNEIRAGQTITVTFSGLPAAGATTPSGNLTLPLALGGGLLGLALIGAGVWWRVRSTDGTEEEHVDKTDSQMAGPALDAVVDQIAQLYEAHERGEVTGKRYESTRKRLLQEARELMRHGEQEN